jgi:hypothetical protein
MAMPRGRDRNRSLFRSLEALFEGKQPEIDITYLLTTVSSRGDEEDAQEIEASWTEATRGRVDQLRKTYGYWLREIAVGDFQADSDWLFADVEPRLVYKQWGDLRTVKLLLGRRDGETFEIESDAGSVVRLLALLMSHYRVCRNPTSLTLTKKTRRAR